jgi:hypothetical protein
MAKEKWRERQKQWIQSLGFAVGSIAWVASRGLRTPWMMVGLFGGVLKSAVAAGIAKDPRL